VITASKPSWITPFTGLSPRCFGRLVTALRREGAEAVRRGRPWGLTLENRVLLVTAYWRTNLTMRQLAPLFGISKSAADLIIGHLGPLLALQPRQRFAKDAVLIVDGTLVPKGCPVTSLGVAPRCYRFLALIGVCCPRLRRAAGCRILAVMDFLLRRRVGVASGGRATGARG
jgi:hypothetical protein